jgi:Na+-transporting NADH:ubiquinone oxidoreductase subunit NqrC
MKKLSILIILLFSLAAFAQEPVKYASAASVLDNVAAAIRSNDSRELAKYFNNTIEVSLLDQEGTYSKGQAEMIIKNFFAKNPAISFVVNQKGSSAGGAQFLIGSYKSGAAVLRTYVLLKPNAGQLLIQQIQFEAD